MESDEGDRPIIVDEKGGGGGMGATKNNKKTRLLIKPLSINKCWQGRRYKTQDYKKYMFELGSLLPEQDERFDNKPMYIILKWGFSNSASDIDNPIKPFLDILQQKYNFNDKWIYFMLIMKEMVKKGDDYIEYQVGDMIDQKKIGKIMKVINEK